MIVADHLVKQFGPIRAVDDVSFEVRRGDILGFLGPNGAGKSTTMKMVTGFLPSTSGRGLIGGHDVAREPLPAKKLFGYLPENGPLYPEMTVGEFLGFIADVRQLKGPARSQALDRVREICHLRTVWRQTIDTLSKGYRQRVGMAQAILHDPPCLIMDEPTDGLDPNQKAEVRRLIAGMATEKAIILSTHILEEVEAMCNRVIIIDTGRIVVDETPGALLRRHPAYHAVELGLPDNVRATAATEIRGLPTVSSVEEFSGRLLIHPRDGVALEETIAGMAHDKQWPVQRLGVTRVKMEEVFRDLTGRNLS